MYLEGRVWNIALGIHVAMPSAPGGNAVDELDAADLDDAVSVKRVESRRLGIEHDLAHSA
jgi:hypothetical protein